MLQDIATQRVSERLTIIGCRSEVNTGKDARVFHFAERSRKTPERTGDAGHRIRFNGEMGSLAERVCEHHACRGAEARMTRRLLRMRL